MSWIADIVGYALVAGLALLTAGLGIGYVIDRASFWLLRRRDAIEAEARRKLGGEIVSLAHWFSENELAESAIREVGKVIAENGAAWPSMDVARERWRRAQQEDSR